MFKRHPRFIHWLSVDQIGLGSCQHSGKSYQTMLCISGNINLLDLTSDLLINKKLANFYLARIHGGNFVGNSL